MTVREWLLARDPRPPAALSARLMEVVGDEGERDASDASDVLLEASERLAAQLLDEGATGRQSALDLLVADALITYAFEATEASAHTIAQRARAALSRIATLAPDAS